MVKRAVHTQVLGSSGMEGGGGGREGGGGAGRSRGGVIGGRGAPLSRAGRRSVGADNATQWSGWHQRIPGSGTREEGRGRV